MAVRARSTIDTPINPCVKYALFTINFLFWLLSLLIIGVGVWSYLEEYGGDQSQPEFQSAVDVLLSISLVLIITGSVQFLITFSGCLGALRENICLLRIFSGLMTIILLCVVSLTVLGFVFPDKFSHLLQKALSSDPIVKYRDNLNLQNFIDTIQEEFQCCGVSDKGYRDWDQNIYFACNSSAEVNRPSESCGVPFSCCKNPRNLDSGLINYACGHNVQDEDKTKDVSDRIFTQGCARAIENFARRNLHVVAGVSLGIAIIQIFTILLSSTLVKQIKTQRTSWI